MRLGGLVTLKIGNAVNISLLLGSIEVSLLLGSIDVKSVTPPSLALRGSGGGLPRNKTGQMTKKTTLEEKASARSRYSYCIVPSGLGLRPIWFKCFVH